MGGSVLLRRIGGCCAFVADAAAVNSVAVAVAVALGTIRDDQS
jgi:hypothetical protein